MSDEIQADPPRAETVAPAQPTLLGRAVGWHRRRMLHWLEELLIVFVGVYAAFFLNYRFSHRQERQRHEQLLAWVQDRYKQVLDNSNQQLPVLSARIDAFEAKLKAGEMPEIDPISWSGDYDASDSTGLLQSGGYDLLEIETIRDIRDAESALRQLVAVAVHAQQRSDAMILPNLGKDGSVFYDPATHHLRPSYVWVPAVYRDLRKNFETLHSQCTKLLAQVQAERQHVH